MKKIPGSYFYTVYELHSFVFWHRFCWCTVQCPVQAIAFASGTNASQYLTSYTQQTQRKHVKLSETSNKVT